MKLFRLIVVLLGVLWISVLAGCASKGVNLAKSGDLSVQVQGSDQVKIVNVHARQMGNEVLIHADVKSLKPVRFFSPGHLTFELFSPNGQRYFVLDVTRYTNRHVDGHRSSKKHASFWVRMPLEIPKGSVLKVSHHSRSEHTSTN